MELQRQDDIDVQPREQRHLQEPDRIKCHYQEKRVSFYTLGTVSDMPVNRKMNFDETQALS
jgi:hypothetical protein